MPTTRESAKEKKSSKGGSSAKKASPSSKRDPADRSSSRRSKKADRGREDKKKSRSSSRRSSSRSKRSTSPRKSPRTEDTDIPVDSTPQQAPPPLPPTGAEQPSNGTTNPTSLPLPPMEYDSKTSSDFEAGLLFQRRFARNGGVDAKDFQRIWRKREMLGADRVGPGGSNEGRLLRQGSEILTEGDGRGRNGNGSKALAAPGKTFKKFDAYGDGRLDGAEFEKFMRGMVEGRTETTADLKDGCSGPEVEKGAGAAADSSRPVATKASTGAAEVVATTANAVPSTTHYDETTGVPLSREAVASQLSLGHTVVLLSEAYSRRLSRLQTLASSRLMPVREQMLQLRRRIHNRADEVKASKAAVERETMADAGAIVERLRSVEALKQASLAQAANNVTAELERVDKIAQQVTGVTASSANAGFAFSCQGMISPHELDGNVKMVELVQTYPELCSCIERVASTPFAPDIAVQADDFPHETAERLEVLRRADDYEKALRVKDHMLWSALQEKILVEEQCHEQSRLGKEYAEEAREWVALASRLSEELKAAREEASIIPDLRKVTASLGQENEELTRRLEELHGLQRISSRKSK